MICLSPSGDARYRTSEGVELNQVFRDPRPMGLDLRSHSGAPMSEWVARVYRVGKQYRVVVEGLLQFDTVTLEGIEERTAKAILDRVRTSYPPRGKPWADPTAERVMEFKVGVTPARLPPPRSELSVTNSIEVQQRAKRGTGYLRSVR
jgi:hypothetical protein